ncbi:hypothetical protein [Bacteroides graminisolvens]|uniref:hypothetical protein n=1 Tax=Bacteroides graminisolvens TaxID=477666 RepID=UPI0029C7F306|nr:hypothetical protein [Bacteroides graminisolvens]
MDEIADEARDNGISGFDGLVGVVIIVGIIYIISNLIHKEDKKNTTDYNPNDEIDYDTLERLEEQKELEMINYDLYEKEIEPNSFNSIDVLGSGIDIQEIKPISKHKVAETDKRTEKNINKDEILRSLSAECYVDLGLSVK